MVGIMLFGRYIPSDNVIVPAIVNTISQCVPNGECKVIDTFKTPKFKHALSVAPGTEHLHYLGVDCKNWDECLQYAKNFLIENNITTLVITRVTMISGFKADDDYIPKLFESRIVDNPYYATTYMIMKRVYAAYHLVKAASMVCDKVIHFLIDPQEFDFSLIFKFKSYRRVFGTAKKGKYIFMPAFEYGCMQITHGFDKTKSGDFHFHCTAITEDRFFILDHMDELRSIPNSSVRVFGAGKFDKLKRQTDFYEDLAKYRYTLCIPPYDKTTFSIFRFWESVMLDVVPFVHKSCSSKDLLLTFPDIRDIIINERLVVDFDEIQSRIEEFSEERRQSILEKIRSTKSFRKITNLKFIKERWQKIL